MLMNSVLSLLTYDYKVGGLGHTATLVFFFLVGSAMLLIYSKAPVLVLPSDFSFSAPGMRLPLLNTMLPFI